MRIDTCIVVFAIAACATMITVYEKRFTWTGGNHSEWRRCVVAGLMSVICLLGQRWAREWYGCLAVIMAAMCMWMSSIGIRDFRKRWWNTKVREIRDCGVQHVPFRAVVLRKLEAFLERCQFLSEGAVKEKIEKALKSLNELRDETAARETKRERAQAFAEEFGKDFAGELCMAYYGTNRMVGQAMLWTFMILTLQRSLIVAHLM